MSNSLASLLKRSTLDDHEAILKASEDTLKGSPNDAQAQEYKAISLVKLDRYADALKFFEENSGLKTALPEIYAYTLFKSAKYDEASQAISSAADTRAAQHIRLQAAYRAEDWAAAHQAYEQLTQESRPDEDADLRINKLAIDAEGLWTEQVQPSAVPRAKTDDLAAFESAYNSACISVSKGQLEEADILLKRAINLCEHHEEFSDAIKVTELVPLRAQRLFVLKRLGKSGEAVALAKELQSSLTNASVDAKVRKLADNNILSSSDQLNNPFMAHKLFNQAGVPKDSAYFTYEKSLLSANEKAIQLGSFKYDGLIDAGRKQASPNSLPSIAPDTLLTSMFAAAAVARSEISKPAVKKLLPELERRPKDIGLVLTIVQLYVLIANVTAAIDVLHSLFKHLEESGSDQDQKVRYAPGLVGLVVSLYKSQGRQSELKKELSKSAAFWTNQSKAPASLLRAAGIVLLQSATSEDDKTARTIFDKLYSQDANNKSTIAGYVASHASDASKEVTSLANKLTSIKDLTAAVNVDALENAGVQQSANALAIAQAGAGRKRAAADSDSSKPKRVRKSRLPKDYDPNKKPDPERWLPLRDRSTYKPKKKKGKKDDRTQGGGNVNESLDISKQPAGGASEVVNNNSSNNKKKKGKGKK